MAEATLSSNYRIVLPREIREALRLKPGDKLVVHIYKKILILKKASRTSHRAESDSQKLKRSGRKKA